MYLLFFFKQKTAYEMRISDWSSDVCSSDLDVPVSGKPAEVRMGKGKGSPEFWAARVKPGRILFELDGVPGPLAAEAFERAAMKLPIKTKVVARLGDTSHLGA